MATIAKYRPFTFMGTLLGVAWLSLISIARSQEGSWIRKTDMPTPRAGLYASAVDGKIYAMGGHADQGMSTIVEMYDPATDTWAPKAEMSSRRSRFTAGVVDGKIYVTGGESPQGLPTAVEMYEPGIDTWTPRAEMPTPRTMLSSAVVDDKIYVIGGMAFNPDMTALSTVEMYDPATDTWTPKAEMPAPRWGLHTGVVDGKIYVIGGMIFDPDPVGVLTVDVYDPAADSWTTKAEMPAGRFMPVGGVVDGEIYCIGGPTELYGAGAGSNVVETYNPRTDAWTRKADMPTARGFLSAATVDGKIYVIGGIQDLTAASFSTLEVFDPAAISTGVEGRSWGWLKTLIGHSLKRF